MKKMTLYVLLLLLVFAVNAFAAPPKKARANRRPATTNVSRPDPSALRAELLADIPLLTIDNATLAAAEDAVTNPKKEKALFLGEVEAKRAYCARLAEDHDVQQARAYQPLFDRIDKFNTDCANIPMSESEMSVCMSRKSAIIADSIRLGEYWRSRQDNLLREIEVTVRAARKQMDRVEELDEIIDRQEAIYNQARSHSMALRKRMEDISTFFDGLCSGRDTRFTRVERLKYCGDINWDGVRSHLPPLPPLYVTRGAFGTPQLIER